MKVTHLLFPATIAVFLATALPAMAADEQPTAAAKADKTEVKKKKLRPHSHLEEKTGVPVKSVEETSPEDANAKAKQKKKLHLHPRDGK